MFTFNLAHPAEDVPRPQAGTGTGKSMTHKTELFAIGFLWLIVIDTWSVEAYKSHFRRCHYVTLTESRRRSRRRRRSQLLTRTEFLILILILILILF